jgi:ankyrin repeat protein
MTDKYYNTSLSNAALNGKKEVVKFLLKNNAVISPYKREDLMSMLAFRGYSDILFTILDNIEMLSSRHIIFNTLCWWNKGLMLVSAARGGHIGLVNALLERGIRLNDALKKEALDGVCLLTNGSAGVVRLLVENTVDEAVVGRESVFRRLQLLLRVSSRMRAVDLVVPLVNACSVGNLEVITYLLSRGADINGTNSSGDTGLMLASRHCNVGVVSLLLGMGADLHIVGRNGVTAFFYALMGVDGNAGQAAIGIAVELAERGAEIFQTSNVNPIQ